MDPAKIINHCVKLGIPQDVIPDEQYLKKIIRARTIPLLDNFLQLTDERQKVDCIRKNILVQSSKNDKAKVPQRLQKFFTYMKLKEEIKELSKRNSDIVKREKTQLDEIYISESQNAKSEAAKETKELRVSILRSKAISLDENISKEVELEKKIASVSLSRFSNEQKTDELKENLKSSMILLKRFHDKVKTSGEAANAAEQVWIELRDTLRNVPNIFIFQSMLRELEWSNTNLQQLLSSFANKDSSTALEKQLISKLHQHLIVSGIESHSQANRLEQVKESCGEIIENIKNELDKLLNSDVNLSFAYDEEEELVGDYVGVMLKHLVLRGKCEHLTRVIDVMRNLSKEEEKAISDFASATQTTQNIYNLTDNKVSAAQNSIAQMFLISQKLNFGKISMIHLVQELKASSKYQGVNRTMLNITSVVDDAVPSHHAELQAFLEQPVDSFSSISDIVSFELRGHGKLDLDDSLALLIKHVIGECSTMRKLLESMKQNIKINQELQSVPSKVKTISSSLPGISISELENQLRANREAIVEILDNITKTNISSKSLLRNHNRIFQAALTNVYKTFIPPTKKFEGKSFKAHENEFNLYYRMIKD